MSRGAQRKKQYQKQYQKQRKAQGGARRPAQVDRLALVRPLLRLGALAVAGIAVVSLVVGFNRALSSVGIERVSFAGDIRHLTRAQLIEHVNPHLGAGYFGVNLAAIKQAIEGEPWVLKATVEREWPWSLRVIIEEQTPIAYWGREGLLNHRGDVFAPASLPRELDLPLLEGPDPASVNVLEAYQLMTQLLTDTPLKVSHLLLDEQRQWTAVTENGVEIRLGRQHPVRNMKRFLQIYRHALQERFAEVLQVDTRYINGVAVGWRGGRQS